TIARFEQATKRAGISMESRLITTSVAGAADQIGRIARRFELAIVGHPGRKPSLPDQVVDEGVLFESGRPVIFVPYIQTGGVNLDRIMVCWGGRPHARRAARDSR